MKCIAFFALFENGSILQTLLSTFDLEPRLAGWANFNWFPALRLSAGGKYGGQDVKGLCLVENISLPSCCK